MPNFIYKDQVLWGRELDDGRVTLETTQVLDYEDNGGDDDGSTIWRPIYARVTVSADEAKRTCAQPTIGGYGCVRELGHAGPCQDHARFVTHPEERVTEEADHAQAQHA